jgi:hypothetical protein
VPYTPGTGPDILARTIGQRLGERLGQPVVVDNKPGASGNIGADLVAKAAPNGYTLMLTVNTFVITPALYPNLPTIRSPISPRSARSPKATWRWCGQSAGIAGEDAGRTRRLCARVRGRSTTALPATARRNTLRWNC